MRYQGLNAQAGDTITDDEHINQSVNDILLTPIGSRVMRRSYGSLLSELIDQPQNAALKLKIMSACYLALVQWEPRIVLQTIELINNKKGIPLLILNGIKKDNQRYSHQLLVR